MIQIQTNHRIFVYDYSFRVYKACFAIFQYLLYFFIEKAKF